MRKFLYMLLMTVCFLFAGLCLSAAAAGFRQNMLLSALLLIALAIIPISAAVLLYRKYKRGK